MNYVIYTKENKQEQFRICTNENKQNKSNKKEQIQNNRKKEQKEKKHSYLTGFSLGAGWPATLLQK